MGLTIHYSLRSSVESSADARKLLSRLRQRALDLPFFKVGELLEWQGAACDYKRCSQNAPERLLLIQAEASADDPKLKDRSYDVTPLHVIAFNTWPGRGCKKAQFALCQYPAQITVEDRLTLKRRKIRTKLKGWNWDSFCKTQYASNSRCGGVKNFLRCHLIVVAMLDFAKKLGILESVSDESQYWEKRDPAALAREVGDWNEAIASWAGDLKKRFGRAVRAPITKFPDFERLEAAGKDKGFSL
jgi:hypothetical protein